MSQLKEACEEHGLEMPSIVVVEAMAQDSSDKVMYRGRATWRVLGNVLIQGPGSFATQKEARQAAARQCLVFWNEQQRDHRGQQQGGTQEKSEEQYHESENEMVPLVVNLIDSPGHIEFNSEVTAALRVSDGALLVVDAIEGMAVQTEEVLRQALREGVRPVLMINKVDRLFIDQQKSAEEVFDRMMKLVEDVNNFIAMHQLEGFPDQRVSFLDGSVCFGSGYFGWSCSIDSFIESFQRNGVIEDESVIRKSLCKRDGFVRYIIKPIMRMHRASGVLPLIKKTSTDKVTMVKDLLQSFKPAGTKKLFKKDEDPALLPPRKLLKKAMMAWLPAADALVDMIAKHVPSPVEAQSRRVGLLYSGPIKDECGQGIQNCSPSAPVFVYITKMIPVEGTHTKRLLAFGRVFSGTIEPNQIVRVIRTDGSEDSCKIKQIKMFGVTEPLKSASAGSIVALDGLDHVLSKAGTLTSSSIGLPMRHLKMSITPILQHSVKPKNKRDTIKMVSELQRVVDADSTAVLFNDKETGETILCAAGELHFEVLISSLYQASGIEVDLSEPIIAYREAVLSTSDTVLAKSDNKHNRLFIRASPISDEIVNAMSTGDFVGLDKKALGQKLAGMSEVNKEAAKLWAVGPEPLGLGDSTDQPTCLFFDTTFGLQIPQDFKENVISAFHQITRKGAMVGCPMRGVRFDLVDAKFHQDSSHRRPHSVVPAAVRACTGAFLTAQPTLIEPMYKADISAPFGKLNGAYSIIGQRSGQIVDTASTEAVDSVVAVLPVRCASGIADELRRATLGYARCTCTFSGMQPVPESCAVDIVRETRKTKGFSQDLPEAKDFMDKL